MSSPKVLQVGVILFPGALPLDFIGPTCILSAVSVPSAKNLPKNITPKVLLEITYLGESESPIQCSGGVNIVPNMTFKDVKAGKLSKGGEGGRSIDVMLLPGGIGARPWNASAGLQEFVKWAADHSEWVLTVCTGSLLLAHVGGLNGQRATTNKMTFLECKKDNSDKNIEWIPKARWVNSGKFWTAAGVSAGTDMAVEFVRQLCGDESANWACEWAEYTAAKEDDDPWAEVNNLT